MDRQQQYVLRTVDERDIGFVRLWFTDVLGSLKSVAVTESEVEGAFAEGIGFDGSAVDGFARVQESDMLARPDASTFQVLPWKEGSPGVARMFCDIHRPEGEPFAADPRQVLKRNLSKASQMGFTFYVHPEMEFFLFKGADDPTPLDRGGYFDLTPNEIQSDFRRQAITMLEKMGISVEYSHHEVAPSQHEIDLRYADALTMADNIMTYRHVIKQTAMRLGVHASFMPKPLTGEWGSAMHTHLSLFDGDSNAFYDPDDPYRLSDTAKHFTAGLLRHAREITAVTCQWVNSYKRLVPGYEAPVFISWGRHNRSSLIRIPQYKPTKAASTRVEYRAPDPACNPYLAFSVLLAAGLKGIEEGYELPPEAEDNIYEMTEAERRAAGITSLPASLDQALSVMEESELVAEALGEHVFDYFLRNKWQEWEEYRSQVTPFELERYLPTL
ncbi:Glutamine synthetase type I [Euzebya pacifica]|uniref:Glutamine synthetase type I n=2 Tax=Euzebya pacifica TaxID=1608957 RepID=A0A346XXH2_9ACTN|nr:glutamine synthetase family protein [Euzebya pacifica]AXV06919.1 Glutamine synthetase type I [Euzebya pacifica]